MKKIFMLAAITMLSLSSCQNDDQKVKEIAVVSPDVDPDTPADARPFIINENPTNGKTFAPPGNGWGNTAASCEFNLGEIVAKQAFNFETSPDPRSVGGRAPSLKSWGWHKDNLSVTGGNLKMKSRKDTSSNLTCASINSNGKRFEKKYGYFEARIQNQNPNDVASHTAMWLMGDNMANVNETGNDGMEIDVYESCWTGNRTVSTLHMDGYYNDNDHNDGNVGEHKSMGGSSFWSAPSISNVFHVYGLNWNKNILEIYYDGVRKTYFTGDKWIPDVAHFLRISTGAAFGYAVKNSSGAIISGQADSGANVFAQRAIGTEAFSYVSYVRYWTKANDPLYN